MTNDSSTGGYLVPSSAAPASDDALEDQLQAMVVGITGLNGSLVRPRWQPTMPKRPEPDVDWCAIGFTIATTEYTPSLVHDGSGDGSTQLQAHETIDIVASFYGPHSHGNGGLLRDGLQIPQNRETIAGQGMTLYSVGDLVRAPTLENNNWLNRWDLTFRLRRQVNRTYLVRNIQSAEGTVTALIGSKTTADDFAVSP